MGPSLGASGVALARPDACTTSGSTATCRGNQSARIADGVDVAPTIGAAVLQNLTTNVTPVATAVAGIDRFAPPGSGISSIAATFIGGAYQIRTNGSNAHGVLVAGRGHSGGIGGFEAFASEGTGSQGFGGSSPTFCGAGTITASGDPSSGVTLVDRGGRGGAGGGAS